MTKRSVTHATFTIERRYDASPARVFAAFAEQAAKERWYACSDGWDVAEYSLDFRVGGREIWRGGPKGGAEHRNDTLYQDIVPEQRIVYTYAMQLGTQRISVSLATVELEPAGKGTRLRFTEQGAFLDGYDDVAGREEGTRALLEALGKELQQGPRGLG